MGRFRLFRTRHRRLLVGIGAASLACSSLIVATAPVEAAFPGRNGKLLCNSNRTGNSEIFAFDPTGVEPPRQLTFDPAGDIEATASPDGTRIAWTSTRSGDQEIWIMWADGSGAERLTFSPGEDRPGTFSPDGSKIAFQSARFPTPPGPGHSGLEIMIMNADGSNPQRMTNNNFQDSFAHWSPEGDRIAFTTNRDVQVNPDSSVTPNFEIYTLVPVDTDNDGNADVQTRVTNSPHEDAHAHWSPDASQLVFHSRRGYVTPGGLQIDIWRANSTNGSNAVQLTGPDAVFDAFPVWSPDGQKIAWSRDFPSDIWTMNASDGGAKTNITNHPAHEERCDWARLLPCTITGSGTITGTEGDDVICGSPGDDSIASLGGSDVIYAGEGNDRVSAGAGNDIVFGGSGHDSISGGDGNDILFGDQGNDRIAGEGGNDVASGSEDADGVDGGVGTDECYGESAFNCP